MLLEHYHSCLLTHSMRLKESSDENQDIYSNRIVMHTCLKCNLTPIIQVPHSHGLAVIYF